MKQLALFERERDSTATTDGRCRPSLDSERLLATFRASRTAEGAHPRSVRREVSQLRTLLREAAIIDRGASLAVLLTNPDFVARLLREPETAISRSTGRVRLLAVQRLIRIAGPTLGRDPSTDLAALVARLPARRSSSWHTTGALVAGTTGRRRRRGPTLDAADLHRLVDTAGSGPGILAVRDRALVALDCFSGLRPEEITRLRWEDLSAELTVNGHDGLTATVMRRAQQIDLLLPSPASDALKALAHANADSSVPLSGSVFRAHATSDRALSYRAARDVLHRACRRAGLPPVDSASLRAACAHWLRSQGFSDHEVASVMGLVRVRSVDRLPERHTALGAQRIVRETLAR